MRDDVRLASKLFNKYEPHSSLAQPRTFEVTAALEVHTLHALGEHDLVDGTCRWEDEEREGIK